MTPVSSATTTASVHLGQEAPKLGAKPTKDEAMRVAFVD